MTSNLSVLKTPTSFWTKDGYFGIWESTSDKPVWLGNCKHVLHYAQGHARLYPELGRLLRDTTNRYTDTGAGYQPSFRDFLGVGDTGWQMFVHKGDVPVDTILYYNEVMSGFEYSVAATMIQHGMVEEGMNMVQAVSKRYDGRHRAKGEVHMDSNSQLTNLRCEHLVNPLGVDVASPRLSWMITSRLDLPRRQQEIRKQSEVHPAFARPTPRARAGKGVRIPMGL